MEIKTKVETIRVEKICPTCNLGYLISTGNAFISNHPIFSHQCDNCKSCFTLTKAYPYFEYNPIKQ